MDASHTRKAKSRKKEKSLVFLRSAKPARKTLPVDPLRRLTDRLLRRLGLESRRLEISIVGDAESRRINRDYLGRDRPTNVISFASDEPGDLGELIVNADYAAREAAADGPGLLSWLGFYIIHGVLHLAGYDHERSGAAAAARMEEQEESLRSLLDELESKGGQP